MQVGIVFVSIAYLIIYNYFLCLMVCLLFILFSTRRFDHLNSLKSNIWQCLQIMKIISD